MAESTSSGTDRQAFLLRVSLALGRSRIEPPAEGPPSVDESLARLATADDDLPGMFAQQAKAIGMAVHEVTAGDLVAQILSLAAQLEVRRAVVNMKDDPGVADAMRQAGIEVLGDPRHLPAMDAQFDTDLGVTDVHAAVAESGTLVCASDRLHSRGPSLVPPAHVAVVHRSDILPDMIDYWATLREPVANGALPSSISMITGPSKTADIEGVLITGVHGPKEVHIMLVGDEA